MFGDDPTLVPTLAECDDAPELSVVGAEGFDEVLCRTKSLPPLAPPVPPLPSAEPFNAAVIEDLRHLGTHGWSRTNFRYSFLTCKSETEPARPNETNLTVRERTKGHVRDNVRSRASLQVWSPARHEAARRPRAYKEDGTVLSRLKQTFRKKNTSILLKKRSTKSSLRLFVCECGAT